MTTANRVKHHTRAEVLTLAMDGDDLNDPAAIRTWLALVDNFRDRETTLAPNIVEELIEAQEDFTDTDQVLGHDGQPQRRSIVRKRERTQQLLKVILQIGEFSLKSALPSEIHEVASALKAAAAATKGRATLRDVLRLTGSKGISVHAVCAGVGWLLDEKVVTYNHADSVTVDAHQVDFILPAVTRAPPSKAAPTGNKVFVVHGHDEAARLAVCQMLGHVGLDPIVLHEHASGGATVIEKLERYADSVKFAVVLLTPDDVGAKKEAGKKPNLEDRARQNVVMELGYFLAKLGRKNVCALKIGSVEVPSDFSGVVYVPMDTHGSWKHSLATELQDAGFSVDKNKIR